MKKTPFIWLGSGRARKRGVAAKGVMLDSASQAGLPVPAGGILLDEFFQICLEEGLVGLIDGVVNIPDAIWLQEVLFRDVRFPKIKKPVVFRPAVVLGDSRNSSLVSPNQFVNLDDPNQLARVLGKAWSTIFNDNENNRLDVLVMEKVDAIMVGAAVSDQDLKEDLVMIGEGEQEDAYSLPRLRAFSRGAGEEPYKRRLQKLLRGVRRTFGQGTWTIEWGDDGEICWLFSVSD